MGRDYDSAHRRNLSAIGRQIERIFMEAAREAASMERLVRGHDPARAFRFADYPAARKVLDGLLSELMGSVERTVLDGIDAAWRLSEGKNDALVRRVLGKGKRAERYLRHCDGALRAFRERKAGGLGLSERVWRYAEEFRSEIEMGLDMGIMDGVPASRMARDLKSYLQHPDKLFRRVRDARGILHLSKAAADFHPGRGVYRSSYRNARRLAVTETNMAYHTADRERWGAMDFVVGIEIRLSGNHTCLGADGKPHRFRDICDDLAGKYPKDFKFTGWHPQCRCVATPVLMDEDELESGAEVSRNAVSRPPAAFDEWVKGNAERLERSDARGTLPYWVRDNRGRVDAALASGAAGKGEAAAAGVVDQRPKGQEGAAVTKKEKVKKEKKVQKTESENDIEWTDVTSIEEAIERARSYGIETVDFLDASIEEINVILEVFHAASRRYGIKLNRFTFEKDLAKKEGIGGSYNADLKRIRFDLSGFLTSSFRAPMDYADKIAKLQSRRASILRQIEQTEAHLGRSKASDRRLKADIKAFKSRLSDIDIKIKKYESLIKEGYAELPLTVADSFQDIKSQQQARLWHEIGHHIDSRLELPRFREGNYISEYSKEMRGEEFAEWFCHYNTRGSENVPSDLLHIFRKAEYARYGERKWNQLCYDEKSGGYNVAHDLHQFKNAKVKGAAKTGGEAEKWLGEQLSKQGKSVEFLPESGINGKAGDMRFDGKVWDCKYIPLANEKTIRAYLKDARKADCVIFSFDEIDRYDDIINAVNREIGRYKSEGRNIGELPDVYVLDKLNRLVLIKKLKGS